MGNLPPSLYVVTKSGDQAKLWRDRSPVLSHMDIEITERCNNNCIHCYINLPADDKEAQGRELSTEDIREILRQAADLGCLSVRLTGGEPMLRDDFEEIYRCARNFGMRVRIFTNGTLITPDKARLFACIPPLEPIEVSIYGMSRLAYESVTRVPGSYEAAWRGIWLLKKKSIPFVVKSAYLPPNQNEIEEFDRFGMKIQSMEQRPEVSVMFNLRCRHDSEKKNERIRRLRLSPSEALRVVCRGAQQNHLSRMRSFCKVNMKASGASLFSCGAGLGICSLDAYGMLQPCMMSRHPNTTYDLAHGSLRKAMTEHFPEIRDYGSTDVAYLKRCAKCFIKGLCEQCPGKSWMEHGTLDTPVAYLCDVAHEYARYLGLIDQYERAWEVTDGSQRAGRIAC